VWGENVRETLQDEPEIGGQEKIFSASGGDPERVGKDLESGGGARGSTSPY